MMMSLKIRSILVLVVGTVLGLTVSVGGTLLAELGARREARVESPRSTESLELLGDVIDRIEREYVDRIDERRLVEGAIRGMLEELDAHSRYLDAEDYEDIRITTTGNYSGVGLDVAMDGGKVTVVTPLDDAPAARAGILPGDVVTAVDDVPVDEGSIEDTVGRMRGSPGTAVMLEVRREGNDEPLRFALTRADIQVKTVLGEYLGDGYAYVRLSAFSETTAGDLERAALELENRAAPELRGIVLDMRNNPGGVLDAAVRVADVFLEDGLIVSGTGRAREARFEQYAHAGDPLEHVPAVVLVNAGSASAAEIVAGALKDRGRARIVGERTYGKGSVQTVMPIGERGAIKLTTSRYMTPSGRSINGTGIEPDVVVHNDDPRRQYRGPYGSVALIDDTQLREGLRLLGYDPIALSKAP